MGVVRVEMKMQHDDTPLFIRASLPRTFRGLGVFVEVCLLFSGLYLLTDAIARPLEANQTAVLASAAILGLAIVLFFYLVWPLRRPALADRRDTGGGGGFVEEPPLTV